MNHSFDVAMSMYLALMDISFP